MRALGITTIKSSPDLTMVVHLLSPNGRYDMTYLRNYAVLNVKDRLARIDGVGDVQLFGSGDYSMRVWLDPQKVAERGLSAGDVVRADPRAERAGRGRRGRRARRTCRASICSSPSMPRAACRTTEEFGDIVVKTGADGAVTRLRDVARIELGAADYSLRSLLDNKPAVAIPIFQAPGSNAIQISDHVRATMAELKQNMPDGRGLRDRLRPDAVRARLDRGGGAHAARGHRAGGARGDPVPADLARLDHPAGRGAGVDHRHLRGDASASASRSTRCSLFGLVLAIGIVVDDAIVVVENVERNIEQGCRRARPPTRRCAKCRARSSPSRWCWSRCSCRWRSSAA